MTEIGFHFNVPDKVNHAGRLLRKAVGSGAEVTVVGDEAVLAALDAALWQLSPSDFVAHCRSDAEPHVLSRSPVVLAAASGGALPQRPVLVNLGEGIPQGFERFERLIDIVTSDATDRQQARLRWRHYAERGYAITRHDVAGVGGAA